ncbi:MAG: DUF1295 domain-containing protein [Myxococcaceae bacterium]|nr:DUF1295 domain-containing protein [Myxococcaceae bacterium]
MAGPFFELIPYCAALAFVCWLLSVLTREYSWVDRIWSIAPPVYLWAMAARTGFEAPRLTLMAALATAWGARLTFNYARKGGYAKGGEDYRWGVLRSRMSPALFQVFNATFIAPYQNALIFLLTAPGNAAALHPSPLGAADVALAALFLALLALETVADQQQWNFHQAKKARAARGESGPRFCTTGLFRYSRHPNFVCEVGQWWVMFGFAVVAAGTPWQWTAAGAVLLTLLFDGSTRFTEGITRSRYAEYAEYQAKTSRLLPWFPRA